MKENENRLIDQKMALIITEYNILNDKIKHFDNLNFQLKGWLITIWTLLNTFALSQNNFQLSLISLVPICIFAFLEWRYRFYQRIFISRIEELEAKLATVNLEDFEKQIVKVKAPLSGLTFKKYFTERNEKLKKKIEEFNYIIWTSRSYYGFYASLVIMTTIIILLFISSLFIIILLVLEISSILIIHFGLKRKLAQLSQN